MRFVDNPETAVLAAAKDMLRRGLVEGTAGNISARRENGNLSSIVNMGTLRAADGGFIALSAAGVVNQVTISVSGSIRGVRRRVDRILLPRWAVGRLVEAQNVQASVGVIVGLLS